MPSITPNLWFDDNALEAAEFYISVFPTSEIGEVARSTAAGPGPSGSVISVAFTLDGQRFVGINGGPQFSFDEAVSFQISCKDQNEIDRYWEALTADGGEEGRCGWLKDKFGLSWQAVPEDLGELFTDPDRAEGVMRAMMTMHKFDLAALHTAAGQSPS